MTEEPATPLEPRIVSMNRCHPSVLFVAWAMAVVVVGGASQQPEQQQPIFRGARDAVRVFATVTDRDGRLVLDDERSHRQPHGCQQRSGLDPR